MISDISKSVSATLYERVASPFYGALLVSWSLWNWKTLYITIFISEASLQKNKIEWIIEHCSNPKYLIVYPLISTLLIITIMPFVTNAAYWLHLKFIKWRRDQKNSIDMKTLLTTEQSIQIREEIIKTEEKFDNLLNRKNQEIKELNIQLESLRKPEDMAEEKPKMEPSPISNGGTFLVQPTVTAIANKIRDNRDLQMSLDTIIKFIQNGWRQLAEADTISPTSLAFFEVNQLVKNEGDGMFSMTDFGRDVVKVVLDERF